jgi:hypothetical protein
MFATSKGEALGNWDQEAKTITKDSGIANWHRHDLRRTATTMLGEVGEMPNVLEASLNHVSIGGQLAATYNRSRYRPQVPRLSSSWLMRSMALRRRRARSFRCIRRRLPAVEGRPRQPDLKRTIPGGRRSVEFARGFRR